MKEYSYGIAPYKFVDDDIYILLNKTSKVSDWNFFKGKIEKGESLKDCALREFFEESGILLTKDDLENEKLGMYFIQKNKKKNIGIFLSDFTLTDHTIKSDPKEIFSWDWVKLENGVVLSKNQQQIWNDIVDKLKR